MQKIITAFLILLCYEGFTQSNQAIHLNPTFKKGETRKYQIIYAIKSGSEGLYLARSTTKKNVEIKIIDVRDNLIDVEWIYLDVTFTDSIPENNPTMDLMNTLTYGITVKYTIDNKGVIKSVTNYDEISAKIKQHIDAMIETMSKDKSMSLSSVEGIKFQCEMMFSSPSQINEIVIGDVFKFHELYGHSFVPNTKSLIQSLDLPTDKYEVRLISNSNNLCRLEGTLPEDSTTKRRSFKAFEFETPSYWLTKYVFKLEALLPISVYQNYEITATNN